MSELLPNGWKEVILGDLCKGIRGVAYAPEYLHQATSDQTVTLLRSNNIANGSLIFSDVQYVDQRCVKEQQILMDGDIAVCMSNGSKRLVGKAAIFKNKAPRNTRTTVGAFCSIFRSLSSVDPNYVAQIFWSDQFKSQVEFSLAGSAINNLKNGDLEKYSFYKPPLPEQQKIATILSSVDDVIEKTRAQIDKLKDLKTGMMQELLTQGIEHTEFKDSPVGRIPASWSILTLGDITESSAFGPRFSSELYSEKGNVGCIRTTDIDADWKINYRSVPLALLPSSEIKNHVLQNGDLLVTRSGTCGVVDVFREQPLPMIAAAFLIRFRLSSKVNPWFIKYLTMSPSVQDLIQQLASGGVQQNLSGTSLKTLQIALPPLSEQNQIVKIISSLEESITFMREKFSHFTQLKKALMQDLLTGKVRVKLDPTEVAAA